VQSVTRRRFLIGGAAASAVVIGGAGLEVTQNLHGTRRFLHRHGVLGGPDARPPAVSPPVEYGTTGTVNYGLYVPTGAPTVALYCLHGRGGNRHDAFDSMAVHRFVADRNLPWAVASLDGGEEFWHHRRDGSDTQRDLIDVLMPLVASRAPAAKSALIGWSMGGFGALLISMQHPQLFSAAVANGPSVWPTFEAATPGAFDDDADFRNNDVMAHASSLGESTRIDCGDDDPFADAVHTLARAAPHASVHVSDGYHEDATWRSFLPAQLEFIQRHTSP
jgi:enterochelin esterase-like enzyme